MTIKTERMTLFAFSPEQLRTAADNPGGTLRGMGLHIEPLKPEGLRLRRSIYGVKYELTLKNPEYHLFCTSWQMALTATGTVVGELGFKGPPVDGWLEIGYGTEYRYRNRGYMKEAVRALCGFGLSSPGITGIAAFTDPENYASQSVLASCGFVPLEREGKHLKFKLTGGA